MPTWCYILSFPLALTTLQGYLYLQETQQRRRKPVKGPRVSWN